VKSQVRFVMHPDDEAALIKELLSDQSVLLIEDPREYPTVPPDVSVLSDIWIIWVPEDLQQLPADYIEDCKGWYCRGEYATIQFWKSKIVDTVITEGRFAIMTRPEQVAAVNVGRRYEFLRRAIKRSYSNSVVWWHNTHPGPYPKGWEPTKSSKPDSSVWVGPAAMGWLAEDASRRIKQFLTGHVEGTVDRPG
jgi:hypothetical protein